MNTDSKSSKQLWGRRLIMAALLSFLAVAVIDTAFGVDAIVLIRQHDDVARQEAQAIFDPASDPVAELYGLPESLTPLRIIVWDKSRLITPAQAPDQPLFFVDRPAGQSVLQARGLWARVAIGALPLALLGVWMVLRGRKVASERQLGAKAPR